MALRKVKSKNVNAQSSKFKVQSSKFKFQRRKHSLTELTDEQIKQKPKSHRDLTVLDITEIPPRPSPRGQIRTRRGELNIP